MAKIADFLKVPGYNARRAAESTDSDRDKLEEELAKIDAEYDKAAAAAACPTRRNTKSWSTTRPATKRSRRARRRSWKRNASREWKR